MENYRKSSHCTYDIKYHLVWITKYRKPVITGKIALRTRELIRIVCQSNEVEILAGHVGSDHIHLLVSVPSHLSASKLVQYIKGNTSRKLQMEYCHSADYLETFSSLYLKVLLDSKSVMARLNGGYPAK